MSPALQLRVDPLLLGFAPHPSLDLLLHLFHLRVQLPHAGSTVYFASISVLNNGMGPDLPLATRLVLCACILCFLGHIGSHLLVLQSLF
jgi:hypothetical protein